MTNPAVQYGSQFTADTKRGPSANVWGDCPWLDIVGQSTRGCGGHLLWEDFDKATPTSPTAQAALGGGSPFIGFGSSGSTIAVAGTAAGSSALVLKPAATNNLGGSIGQAEAPFTISNVSAPFWFEARIATDTITTLEKPFICGMSRLQTLTILDPLIADGGGLISTADFVGFQRVEADTTTMDTTHQAGGVTQVIHDNGIAGVLAVDTFVKLGMRKGSDNILRFYVNGVEQATTHTVADALGTSFPSDVGLRFVLAYINGAAVASSITIDWLRIAQLGPLDE